MFFVCHIHNNKLGISYLVDTIELGIEEIKIAAKHYLNRELFYSEIEEIENELEFYNEDDADNIVTYSVGILENK